MEEERREIRIVILLLSNSGASTGKERHVTIPVTFTSRKQYMFDGFLNKAVSAKLFWLKGGHPHNICAKWFDKKK